MALNSTGAEAMTTDSPSTASAVCTASPACTPATETKPVRRPEFKAWRKMTMVAGPGETTTADAASIKAANRGGSMGRARAGMGNG